MTNYTWAQSPALNQPVTLSYNNTDLATVIAEISKQVPLSFTYDHPSLSAVKVQHAIWKGVPLKKVLSDLSLTTGMIYEVSENTVAIKIGKQQRPGGIHGRVVDFETSTPLPGATVQLEGTTTGTITDAKGFYKLPAVIPGRFTLIVTFIGYQRAITANVQVESDKQSVYDVKMQSGGSLKEVVIDAGPRKVSAVTHSTEAQLLQEIRNARGVVSGISNEQISRTADRNAAEIVKRIAGVTVVDDKFIVVRGMNTRYNITYLNGNIAPATELYSRAFAYDLLPAPIIDKILVYKSPAADLQGDYAGGAIRVYTKNAKPVRHLDIGIQMGYRPGSNFGAMIHSYQGGKYDWLGFDDGTRKLSSKLPGYFESGGRNTLSQQQLLQAFTPVLQYGNKSTAPDLQGYVNYYDNWKLGKWRLYDLTSLTYSHETRHNEVYLQGGNKYGYGGQSFSYDKNYFGNDDQSIEKGKMNLLQNFTLKLNDWHQLLFNNFVLNEGNNFTSILSSRANAIPALEFGSPQKRKVVLSFQQRMLYTGNLGGEHHLSAGNRDELQWNLGFSFSKQDVPDQRVLSFFSLSTNTAGTGITDAERHPYRWISAGTSADDYASIFYGKIARIYTRHNEKVYNASLDYTYHLNNLLSLKVGTYHLFRSREVGRRFFKVDRAGLTGNEVGFTYQTPGAADGYGYNDYNIIKFRMHQLGKVWSPAYFPEDNSGLKIYDMTSPADSYIATEQDNSGYAMGNWRSKSGRWLLNAGLRVIYDQQKVAGAYKNSDGLLFPVGRNNTGTDMLPSINISYQRPDSVWIIRSSYGRTVNRPEFRELTPYSDFDFLNNELIRGNSMLKTAAINNIDLRAEWYPRNGTGNEMISAGIFYKHLQHPIERARMEAASGEAGSLTMITFFNAEKAWLYGAEIEMRKNLSFIQGNLFRNMSVLVNAAYIKSIASSNAKGDDAEANIVRAFRRPLQGQAPYVINAGVFYENPGWGTKLGLIYNVSGPSIYAVSAAPDLKTAANGQDSLVINMIRPDLVALPVHLLDFSYTQRIVRSFTMRLNVQNILDQSYRLIENHSRDQRYHPEQPHTDDNGRILYYTGDNIYRSYKPGRYLTLSFTYAF